MAEQSILSNSHPQQNQQQQQQSSQQQRMSISNQGGLPTSPATSGGASSSGLTRLSASRYGSISTLATSNAAIDVGGSAEWDPEKRPSVVTENMDYESEPQVLLPVSTRPKGHYSLSDFTIHRTLGTGSFGRVHLGMCSASSPVIVIDVIIVVRSKHNWRYYAIKVLSKDKVVRTKQVQHTNNEREMLEAVQHPFIVNLWGTFQDFRNLYMVMDFVAGGELFTLLRRSNVRRGVVYLSDMTR